MRDSKRRVTVSARFVLAAAVVVASVLTATASAAGPAPRATVDRPDLLQGPQTHVVYFVPAGSRDARVDADGTIARGIEEQDAWFSKQSGGYRWRYDRFGPKRQIDVTFVRGSKPHSFYKSAGSSPNAPGNVLHNVRDELRQRKIARDGKQYAILYGGDMRGTGYCGVSDYPIWSPRTYTPAGDPYDFLFGAVVYLVTDAGCRNDDWGSPGKPGHVQSTLQHELVHSVGLSPPGAPHTCDPTVLALNSVGHVCGFSAASSIAPQETIPLDPERFDLMFPFSVAPLHELVLDRGHDDYFNTTAKTIDLKDSVLLDPPSGPRPAAPAGTVVPDRTVVTVRAAPSPDQ